MMLPEIEADRAFVSSEPNAPKPSDLDMLKSGLHSRGGRLRFSPPMELRIDRDREMPLVVDAGLDVFDCENGVMGREEGERTETQPPSSCLPSLPK